MNDIFVKKVNLPVSIGAYTIRDKNSDFTVFINARSNYERQLESYFHELEHINNGDFDKEETADSIELKTHNIKCVQ